jgi:hypothetical protein
MANQHGTPRPPGHGVRPTDKDPQPSEGQDEKDLGEDEGADKDGSEDAGNPQGRQATSAIDLDIDKSGPAYKGHAF